MGKPAGGAAEEAHPRAAEGTVSGREGKRWRKRTRRTDAKLAQGGEILGASPHASQRHLDAHGGLSRSVAQRALREAHGLKSLRQMIAQRVQTSAKQKRLVLAAEGNGGVAESYA